MKTASVRQLRTSFPQVEKWLAAGETVSITKRRKVIAELSAPRPQKKPDFAKRFAVTTEDYKAVRPRKTLRDILAEDRGE